MKYFDADSDYLLIQINYRSHWITTQMNSDYIWNEFGYDDLVLFNTEFDDNWQTENDLFH